MTYTREVKYIDWNVEKNEKLKNERGIGFDEAMDLIIGEGLLMIWNNPNNRDYAGQRIFVVSRRGYVYLIPYVEQRTTLFLKTIFPSRKYTKMFRKKGVL